MYDRFKNLSITNLSDVAKSSDRNLGPRANFFSLFWKFDESFSSSDFGPPALLLLAIRLMTFSPPQTASLLLFRQLKLFKLNELLYLSNIKTTFRALRDITPSAVSNALRLKYVSNEIVTRGNTNKMLERFEIRTSTYGRYSIRYQAIIHWNKLQNYCLTTSLSHISCSKVNKKATEFLMLQNWEKYLQVAILLD